MEFYGYMHTWGYPTTTRPWPKSNTNQGEVLYLYLWICPDDLVECNANLVVGQLFHSSSLSTHVRHLLGALHLSMHHSTLHQITLTYSAFTWKDMTLQCIITPCTYYTLYIALHHMTLCSIHTTHVPFTKFSIPHRTYFTVYYSTPQCITHINHQSFEIPPLCTFAFQRWPNPVPGLPKIPVPVVLKSPAFQCLGD